jgi:uncharacterized delta-60 repeat protein
MRGRRSGVALILSWTGVAVLAGGARAAAGDLDPTFDQDGKVTTNFSAGPDAARAVALQVDGKLVAAGRSGSANGKFALGRYDPSGSLDLTFDGDGKVTTDFTEGFDGAGGVAIQENDKIVVAGGANGRFALARYRTDGTLDPNFGGDGKVTTDFPNGEEGALDVVIQADGRIVAAGNATDAGRFALARYKPNGILDPTFSCDGKVTTAFPGFFLALAHGMDIQGNGKVVVAGEVAGSAGGRFALARYRLDGRLDPNFSSDGRVTTDFTPGFDFASDVAIQADGRMVAAGSTGEGSGDPRFALGRYRTDGSLDPSFGGDGRVLTQFPFGEDIAHAVAIQEDGKIVVAGSSGEGGPFSRFAVGRYETDGALDATFSGNGKVTTAFIEGFDFTLAHGVVIQPDGGIVAAGGVGGGGGRFGLARYLAA